MLTELFTEFKLWWIGTSVEKFEEIDRIESKHTRVRFDHDIYEIIRVH